ncbi:Imm42 family immunity protein [Otariodibacter oris]|uniref:Immunity protein 42 of polymorphic toxin system n=1 Tax=Otariodibacter oris TaxID=1032623 RepID=A0A420XGJ9_9PAST|nr:Imm42 family immunity protein [Otariodibacter oris]QGM81123.1 hypothetical protein A6A10_06745 [Otariodibacter oris]RKR72675.1 immunity protein 42 of polymorphic toxin system [Otariodibacter oris]
MIFGNPDKFAIHCDIVKEWNDDYFWVNGIFNVYIQGKMIVPEVAVSELKFTLANIENNVLDALQTQISLDELNSELFLGLSSPEMEDKSIFIYYFFTLENDFIFIKNNQYENIFKYNKKYIHNILSDIVLWKKSILFFID